MDWLPYVVAGFIGSCVIGSFSWLANSLYKVAQAVAALQIEVKPVPELQRGLQDVREDVARIDGLLAGRRALNS